MNRVAGGDCLELIAELPEESIDVAVTSPPYWGQRLSGGLGVEEDPREYVKALARVFVALLPKLKPDGILWINLGDAFNTPVNWRTDDYKFSTLGPERNGLPAHNSAYVKPRSKRRAFIDPEAKWLTYGNLLALPNRLAIALCDAGFLYRGEVIWKKRNPMPEGQCRRPHRGHEGVYLFAKIEQHAFRVSPPVKSVWEFGNEKIDGTPHYSRFPEELPRQCIGALGRLGPEVVVLDPFAGSGTTGIAAVNLGCLFVGFEIDPSHVSAANERIEQAEGSQLFAAR